MGFQFLRTWFTIAESATKQSSLNGEFCYRFLYEVSDALKEVMKLCIPHNSILRVPLLLFEILSLQILHS